MIGLIRRKMREVRYYSARREETVWTRAGDFWLLASLPVALGIVALVAVIVRTDNTTPVANGWLMQLPDGRLAAAFATPDLPVDVRGRITQAVEIQQRHEEGGWPLIMWEHVHVPVILVRERGAWHPVSLVGDDERATALREGLAVSLPELGQRCFEPAQHRIHYAALTGIAAVLWLALVPLGLLGILLLRLGAGLVSAAQERRRMRRRIRGLCPRCGYPVRGLEFVSSCPECGELLT